MLGGMHGRGHAWQGVHAWQGGMHGRGCAWQGACMAGGHAWQRGVHGTRHAWQGACMAGGHAWQGGMHGIRSMSGRYTSCWNALLFNISICRLGGWEVVESL